MKTVFLLFTKYKFLLLALSIALLSVLGLFHPGLPPTHDGEYHVVRFYEFDRVFRDGNWYPVWAPDLNFTYGVPLFGYVYPLPNYFASFFHLLGLSFIDSFKFSMVVASLLGAIGSYILGKDKFGVWGGVLTSMFYTFAPYHFLDIYIRGSVGEVWALAFFPFALLFLERVVRQKTAKNVIYFGVSYALVIFSHNILAVMFTGFAASYALLLILQSQQKKSTVLYCGAGFLLGLLLSAVFFLPALIEQKYVVGLQIYDVTTNFPELFQLLIPSWGSGFSGNGMNNQMSFQIGLINLFIVGIVFVSLFIKKLKNNTVLIMFLLAWLFFLCFLMTPYSIKIWQVIPYMNYFQFPWRLLSLVILITSLLAGSIAVITKRKLVYAALIILLLLTTYSYAHYPYFMNRNDRYYETKPNFIYSTNSIGDVFQTKWFPRQKKLPAGNLNSLVAIRDKSTAATTRIYKVSAGKQGMVIFNTAFFPGWKAHIGIKEVSIMNKNGLIGVKVPKGDSTIVLKFTDTPVRLLAKIISTISLIVILVILFKVLVIQYFYARGH